MKKTPDPFFEVRRADVPAVNGMADAFARQRDRGEPRQHLRKGNHRVEAAGRFALERLKRERLIERDVAAPGPAKAEEMCAYAELFPKVVRQRAYIKASGAVHS